MLSSPTDEEMKIVDLPEWAIREIIDYIPKTSRALLALALTTDSASWRDIHWNKSAPKSILEWFRTGGPDARISKTNRPSAITKAILSPKNEDEEDLWEEINFEDNEWALCAELTDDDIAGMLTCINSVQRLKQIYLTHCYKITGRALEPLRGSTVLERLDLSLRPRRGYDANYAPPRWGWGRLSRIHVLPILHSIIDREHHSLKHIQFPRFDFVDLREHTGYFQQFLLKYDETGHHQNAICRNCSADCNRSLSIFRDDKKDHIGIQKYTCYDCLNHYCYNCKDEEGKFYLSFCKLCEKWRCKDCQVMKFCRPCIEDHGDGEDDFGGAIDDYTLRNNVSFICKDCTDENHECGKCGDVFCPDCISAGENDQIVEYDLLVSCGVCSERGCIVCMDLLYCEHASCELSQCEQCRAGGRDEEGVSYCHMCDSIFCFKHRLEDCKRDWRNSCGECLRTIAPTLVRSYEER